MMNKTEQNNPKTTGADVIQWLRENRIARILLAAELCEGVDTAHEDATYEDILLEALDTVSDMPSWTEADDG